MHRILLTFLLVGCANPTGSRRGPDKDPIQLPAADSGALDNKMVNLPTGSRDGGTFEAQDGDDGGIDPWDAGADAWAPEPWDAGQDAEIALDTGVDTGFDAGPPPQTCDHCEDDLGCPEGHECVWYPKDDELRCLPLVPPGGCSANFPDMGLAGYAINSVSYCVPTGALIGCDAWQASYL